MAGASSPSSIGLGRVSLGKVEVVWAAEAEDGRRLGVVLPERKPGSAGVEGGGMGPGGESETMGGSCAVGVDTPDDAGFDSAVRAGGCS